MKRALTPSEIEVRVDKLREWLEWTRASYEDLLSREESAGAPSGFAEPRKVKHIICKGRGCDECESGFVEVFDPYSQDVHVWVKVEEAASSKKAQRQALSDETLRVLKRNERVRNGEEALPDAAVGKYLRVYRKPQGYKKIQKGLWLLSIIRPSLYDQLPSHESLRAVVILMHRLVGGRFPNPPSL